MHSDLFQYQHNDDYRIEKLADLAFYTEGPVCDNEGNFFCTTLTAGVILKRSDTGSITKWATMNAPNGQIILPDDTHLVCDTQEGVIHLDRHGKVLQNLTGRQCAGTSVSSFNDLCRDKAGNIYFTDSVRKTGKVCVKKKDGTERILASNLDFPNGIVLARDERTLYVAESYQNRILAISPEEITADGEARVLTVLPKNPSGLETGNLPDGLDIDEEGNLWVAHYGMQAIQMLSPDGALIRSFDTGLPLTSNLFIVDPKKVLFTGGYNEPGPGGLFLLHL